MSDRIKLEEAHNVYRAAQAEITGNSGKVSDARDWLRIFSTVWAAGMAALLVYAL